MKILKVVSAATVLILSSSANAHLIESLGGLAYYDDEADLTWLADANASGTTMNWVDANNWAANLTVSGVGGWRLADTLQPDASCSGQSASVGSYSYDCTGSEMGNLFYNVLGNTAGDLTNTGPFSNVQRGYWTATQNEADPAAAWCFLMASGYQCRRLMTSNSNAWAVQSGTVSAVPVPAAAWLFGSGLIGLVGLAKRKRE